MVYSICLALFDLRKGPYVAFNRNIGDDVASRVALKSMIALGSMDDWNKNQESEAIISIPEDKVISFFRIFPILNIAKNGIQPSEGDKYLPASVIFVTEMTNQMQIYQDAPKLSEISKTFAKQLKETVKQKKDITQNDIDTLVTTYLSKDLIDTILEKGIDKTTEIVVKETQEVEPQLNLWKRYLDDNIDMIIRQLIIGGPLTFILKDKRQAPMQIAISKVFTPHLDIKTKLWSTIYNQNVKIQCGPEDIKTTLPSSMTIFDQVNYNITGGKNNDYCKELIQKAIQYDSDRGKQFILSQINDLLSDIGILIAEITSTLDIEDNKEAVKQFKNIIEDFKEKNSTAKLDIIEGLMNRTNPEILDRIKQKYLLDSTRVQIIQQVIIESIGPAGKILVRKIVKNKLKKQEYELESDDIQQFTDEFVNIIKSKEILDEQEIIALRENIQVEADDFRSLIQKTSIFS